MSIDRAELHNLVDRIPENDLAVTRKLLRALAIMWDVAPADVEGEFTEEAARDLNSAEAFFDSGGEGIRHQDVLKEYGLE